MRSKKTRVMTVPNSTATSAVTKSRGSHEGSAKPETSSSGLRLWPRFKIGVRKYRIKYVANPETIPAPARIKKSTAPLLNKAPPVHRDGGLLRGTTPLSRLAKANRDAQSTL